jgi:hypothetical protein
MIFGSITAKDFWLDEGGEFFPQMLMRRTDPLLLPIPCYIQPYFWQSNLFF